MSLSLKNWNKKSSKIGRIFHTWIAGFFGVCTTLGMANEYLVKYIPSEWIPDWVKITIIIAGLISFVGGKSTKEEENGNKA